MLKSKVTPKEHSRLVSHARELLKIKQEAKWEIVRIAIKVCYLQDKKGKIPKDSYTITHFAEDIGMNRKTLSCWILDYQSVYQPLKLDDTKLSFSERIRLNGAIARTRAKMFNFNKGRSVTKSVPVEKVQEVFNSVLNKDPLLKRLEDFIKNLKHHKFTLKNEKFTSKHKQALLNYGHEIEEVSTELARILRELK